MPGVDTSSYTLQRQYSLKPGLIALKLNARCDRLSTPYHGTDWGFLSGKDRSTFVQVQMSTRFSWGLGLLSQVVFNRAVFHSKTDDSPPI